METKIDRRALLGTAAMAAVAGAAAPARRRAEACIFLWLGGGMGQVDTFDPKAVGNGTRTGKPGSLYPSIPTTVPGVRVCEHLPKVAGIMERLTAVRSVNHKVIDEHAFATNLVHTGRMISGNVTYPSIGSIIAHTRGAGAPDVPAYMLIGYPNVSRGPGFLGAKANHVYLTDTEAGPSGFSRPATVDARRASEREGLLAGLSADAPGGVPLAAYRQAQEQALRLSGPGFLRHFNLKDESADVRSSYGGEFGQRCLLARRLVEAGVRFVEVSHNLNFLNGTGWDVHNEGIRNQHLLIRELDTALSGLVIDLERRGILDSTLVVVATEFGRPPEFDGRGGRGHQGSAFTMVLAGGGLRHKGAHGVTDDAGKKVLEAGVSIPDFHATILASLGVNPALELMDATRPVPVTDGGRPVEALMG
ncbi:MAG: DUF1501 domain-containing protein [Planctomycetes bacterium]|nr:DUF1501 domain-containing protein [Planctomycetota bacterium]